jgi:hypothetical protein
MRSRSVTAPVKFSENAEDAQAGAEVVEGELLTADQLAQLKGVSRATIDRARKAGRLPAVPLGKRGGWGFRRTEIVEMGEIRQQIPVGGVNQVEGDRDARVVAAFENGRSIVEVVMAEKIPIHVVMSLRASWLKARETERVGIRYNCGCGAPADPRAARCLRCHEKSRVLSDAERAVLAGGDIPPPGTCACQSCGHTVRVEDADSLCLPCKKRMSVGVVGGVLVVAIAGKVWRSLSVAETRGIALAIAHHLPRTEIHGGPPPDIDTVEPPAGKELQLLIKSIEERMGTT